MFERVGVLGSGAIGSVIGGYLTRAGNDVTLIDAWPEHVDTMKRDGLTVTAQDEKFTVPVNAIHVGEVCNIAEPFDAVFISLKSYDTVWGTHLVLPHLKPTGVMVSAQNAINDERIARIVGFTRSMPCVVTIGAGLYEPGHVTRTSIPDRLAFKVGELNGMPTQRAERLADMLGAVGITQVTKNPWGERWAKLATNSMANPICGITGLGSGAARQTSGVVDVMIGIAAEVVAVGSALGVEVEPINGVPAEKYVQAEDGQVLEDVKSMLSDAATGLGEGRPSMLQDVLKGRRTEIAYLNGYVVEKGREAGVPTPLCETVTQAIRDVESGLHKPDVSNIQPLLDIL